ncbi:metalloregulator ArsR/SmtB family transcription factor [Arthrobacter sp. H20]|uniref:ArsR/SmtB family transcription factor n=1 Tax=Arthrobacter sp. H20 TaxID=1267981 RepID=UPI00047A64F9|nr:metalloregulator ArsR/SmtB family transcription factor [Arthrobacter sp. H20]
MENVQPADGSSLHHPDTPDARRLDTATATFRMLSDPTRLHILWLLAQDPSDVGSLVERTGASRTSVSQHLAKLRFSGLVTTRKSSRHVVYSISDGHLTRLVMEGLNHADHKVTGEPAHD